MSPKKTSILSILFFLVCLLVLPVASLHADFGNRFVADKRLSTSLDSTDKKMSYRFTCQEDMTLTAAAVYCLDAVSSPAYLVSIQEDEKGVPSGYPLVSASFIPRSKSWSTLPLDPLPLLKNKVYHLVIEQDVLRGGGHPVGVIGRINYASFLSTDILNHLHPNDGSPDPQTNTLMFEKGKWRELDQEPVFVIYGTGFHFQGNPYDDPGLCPVYGGGNPNDKSHQVLQGQALHFHCGMKATGLVVRVKKRGNPKSPLNYCILANNYRAHECHPIIPSTLAVASDEVSADFKWVTIGLPETESFPAECYYFVFQTNAGRPSKDPPAARTVM